jgi:hypothetical protein
MITGGNARVAAPLPASANARRPIEDGRFAAVPTLTPPSS